MMVNRTVAFALIVAAGTVGLSAEMARDLYVSALAREHTVRAAMTGEATPAVLSEVRAVVAAYRSAVKHYPASGYSDNALWQAGRLSIDAFTRFHQLQDREAGVRLLRALAATYPTSKLAPQVPDVLSSIDSTPAAPLPGLGRGPGPAFAPHVVQASLAAARPATLRTVRRTVLPDAVRIVIEIDTEVPFHEERIENPDRVFIDLSATRAGPTLADRTLRFAVDADIVRQVRIGRQPGNTTRVVVDAAGVSSYSVYPLYDPYRLVIDCVRAPASTVLAARSFGSGSGRLPSVHARSTAAIADAIAAGPSPLESGAGGLRLPFADARDTRSDSPEPSRIAATTITSPVAGPMPSSGPPARNTGGGFSIARQLGLGVARIVIDPGHGGHDPGAQGKDIDEAELVLDIALRLEKLLQRTPGTEVLLTRRTDEYIPLQERTAIANREGADLFLSIHANASAGGQARGIETYFLNFANSMGAASVAARENAASGQAMGALPDFVKAIALNNKLDESRDFAAEVQRSMLERLRATNKAVKDLGVKQAPFVVLIGAAMPSVLAEISFVTNQAEARLLRSNAYRQRIAEALFNAIRKYQGSLKNVKTAALR